MSVLRRNFVIEPMDLARDWPGIERLLTIEGWPYVYDDLALWAHDPRAIALVVREAAQLQGYFIIQPFDHIAYLDNMLMDPSRRRNVFMTTELFTEARRRMDRQGFNAYVTHCTPSSARMARLLGYRPGQAFDLMRREARRAEAPGGPTRSGEPPRALEPLEATALGALVDLDTRVFGLRREPHLHALMQQAGTRFYGRRDGDHLVASVCLRARRGDTLCVDACNALDFAPLQRLLDDVLQAHAHRPLDCFVKQGIDLQHHLERQGFGRPPGRPEIASLVEYRLGPTGEVGLSPAMRTMSWT